jgi:hypothetical protein
MRAREEVAGGWPCLDAGRRSWVGPVDLDFWIPTADAGRLRGDWRADRESAARTAVRMVSGVNAAEWGFSGCRSR